MRKASLYIMSALYIFAGINHSWHEDMYLKIMPHWLPYHHELVFISGVCEIVLGIMLIPKFTRRLAAWGIILLLIAVFPANIQMLINFYQENNPYLWAAILRLPLQVLLVWWAWSFTKKE